jgi:citrate lyase subunit beta/citryl-CoA lyase
MSLRDAGPGWLFCPADRPERFAKAAAAADVVILDLEDGVAEADKPAARKALQDTPLDPARTVVRINAAGTDEYARDLEALAGTAYTTVMLPKTESAGQVTALAPRDVVALVESARGVVLINEIAAAENTVAMMYGAEDLTASLGGSSSRRPDGPYRDVSRHVRSATLLAASAFGRLALDAVHLDIPDVAGLEAEATDAVAVGFDLTV